MTNTQKWPGWLSMYTEGMPLTNFLTFFKFNFDWRIIVLQHCVGFCHTSTWTSHRSTYVPSLLSLPPTSHPIPPPTLSHLCRLSESTGWSSLPLKFPLATYFTCGNGYVSMLFSKFVPPSSSPNVSASLFYACVFHCCPANRFISTIFLDPICLH